jgi:predicted nuclease of predicted toxin-antitoxin system
MRLLLDENMGPAVVAALQAAGHDVVWVRDVCPGALDDAVLALAQETARVLVTGDRGIGKLARMSPDLNVGVVILRLNTRNAGERAARLLEMLPVVAPHMTGHFAILTSTGCRLRRLSQGVSDLTDGE